LPSPVTGGRRHLDNKRELKPDRVFDDPPAPLKTIEPLHLRQYLSWRNAAPIRANREKALLSAIWNFARDKGGRYDRTMHPQPDRQNGIATK
jgi:hypothetical protein